MKPTKAWAVVLDDRPLLSFVWHKKPDISEMHKDCPVVRVEIRELPATRKPRAPRGTR
jgi:hypothetical protein